VFPQIEGQALHGLVAGDFFVGLASSHESRVKSLPTFVIVTTYN
jgi:hypothetical protein